jgi:hypothetical protein
MPSAVPANTTLPRSSAPIHSIADDVRGESSSSAPSFENVRWRCPAEAILAMAMRTSVDGVVPRGEDSTILSSGIHPSSA